jgi:hypothetical protein
MGRPQDNARGSPDGQVGPGRGIGRVRLEATLAADFGGPPPCAGNSRLHGVFQIHDPNRRRYQPKLHNWISDFINWMR